MLAASCEVVVVPGFLNLFKTFTKMAGKLSFLTHPDHRRNMLSASLLHFVSLNIDVFVCVCQVGVAHHTV